MTRRDCPRCGTRGIVRIVGEVTVDPAVTCPTCGNEWIAGGTQGVFAVPDNEMTDEEAVAWATRVWERMMAAEKAGISTDSVAAFREIDVLTLLADQPRLSGDDTGEAYETRRATMAEIASGLESVVTRLAADGSKRILIIERGPSDQMVRDAGCVPDLCLVAYVQWLIYPDGSLVAEASSTRSLGAAHALTREQEEQLLNLGWDEPVGDSTPNFWRFWPGRAGVAESARLAIKTLLDVFEVEPDQTLLVKMKPS